MKRRIVYLGVLALCFLMLASPLHAQTPTSADADSVAGESYIVQLNDSLSKLAEQFLGDLLAYPLIVEATNAKASQDDSFLVIDNPDLIEVGQKLWIPLLDEPLPVPLEPDAEATVTPAPADSGSVPEPTPVPLTTAGEPSGQIAFSFFNDAANRCVYEVNVINVPACLSGNSECQQTRRIIPFNNIAEPALSPDGNDIAFRGFGPQYPNTSYSSDVRQCANGEDRLIAASNLDGTDYRPLTNNWEDGQPDWSPDGNSIIFNSNRAADRIMRLYITNPEGTSQSDLRMRGEHPSWGPDNTRFVFRGCDLTGNRCGLWLADRGGNLLSPALEYDRAAHPDWSPTGPQVVYQSPENGNWDLFVVNTDGTNKRQLTNNPGLEGLPVWSPDGQWVAYLSNQGAVWTINVIKADGSAEYQLFTLDGGIFSPTAVEPYNDRSWISEQLSWSP